MREIVRGYFWDPPAKETITGHPTMVAGGGGFILVVLVCLEQALAVLDPGQDSVYVFQFHYFLPLTVSLLR